MDDYTYTDSAGRVLEVTAEMRPSGAPVAYLAANSPGVIVPAEDTPAVSLAILTRAGIEPADHHLPGSLSALGYRMLAVSALQQAEREEAEQAERDAEDAKVQAYRDHKLKANPAYGRTEWAHMHEDQRNVWRKEYSTAREFFTREVTP